MEAERRRQALQRAKVDAQLELVKTGIGLVQSIMADRAENRRLEQERLRAREQAATAAWTSFAADMRARHGTRCNLATQAVDLFVSSTATMGKLEGATCTVAPDGSRAAVYRFYVDSPGSHMVGVLAGGFTPKLALMDDVGVPHLTWSGGRETENGRKILARVWIPVEGEYFLVVSGQGATAGEFAVQVNIPRDF